MSTQRATFCGQRLREESKFVHCNSLIQNPMWDPVARKAGGLSGRLIAQPEVNNDGDRRAPEFPDLALTHDRWDIFGARGPAVQPWNGVPL